MDDTWTVYPIEDDGSKWSQSLRTDVRPDGFVMRRLNEWTRGYLDPHGYYQLENQRVHRIVAELFVPNPRPDIFKIVDHINRVRGDNRAENLRWVNHRLNMLNRSNPAGKVVKQPNPKRRSRSYVRERYPRHFLGGPRHGERRPMRVHHKWKIPPYKVVGFPHVGRGGWFETEEEAAAYLKKCRTDRWKYAYAEELARPPLTREVGTQCTLLE
jgi:hypothetical protein